MNSARERGSKPHTAGRPYRVSSGMKARQRNALNLNASRYHNRRNENSNQPTSKQFELGKYITERDLERDRERIDSESKKLRVDQITYQIFHDSEK